MAPSKTKERDIFSVRKSVGVRTAKKRKRKQDDESAPSKRWKPYTLTQHDLLPLSYKTITAGQLILGCVQEVHNYEVRISLPHRIMGTVSLARISNAYTHLLTKMNKENEEDLEEEVHTLQELYRPGQYLVTRVVSVEGGNNMTKVHLTLMPQEVNYGISTNFLEVGHVIVCAVASVEDKGYVMDTGIPGVIGAFLKNSQVDGSRIMGVGCVVRCKVTKILGNREEGEDISLQLTANSKTVSEVSFEVTDMTNMALLLPGTAIKTTVSKIHQEGLNVLLSGTDGVVSRLHLRSPMDTLKQYKLNMKVLAKVLYIMPFTKVVHLTLQSSVCSERTESELPSGVKIGDRVNKAVVYESGQSGIYLKLGEDCCGFCQSVYLTDGNQPFKQVNRRYPVGSTQECHVLKYSYMDQLFNVSLQKNITDQQVVGYRGIEVGQILMATVKSFNEHGAEVAVGKIVKGLIPLLHLTNIDMKHPEKELSVGQTVKTRVLHVIPEQKHMLLTCKKQLVESQEPIVTEYSESVVGTVTKGFVVKILKAGLLIAFFGDTKGFAPKSKVTGEHEKDLEELFSIGQVVGCKVTHVFPEKRNMTISLLFEDEKASKEEKLKNMKLRDKVDCVVKNVGDYVIDVCIKKDNVPAEIPVHQLCDHSSHSNILKDLIQVGDEIHSAVILRKTKTITLTLKSCILNWIEDGSKELQAMNELMENESYPAVVIKLKSKSLRVTLPVGEKGMSEVIHMKNFTNYTWPLDKPPSGVHVGQCLFASFKEKDRHNRPSLSTSLNDNMQNVTQSSMQLLCDYLREQKVIKRAMMRLGGRTSHLTKVKPGSMVKVIVKAVTEDGLWVTVKNSCLPGVISSCHRLITTKVEEGEEISACVLYVNLEEKCLELTIKPHLIKAFSGEKTGLAKVGKNAYCEVLLSKKNFILVILMSHCSGRVAYVPALRHINDMVGRSFCYSVGQKCGIVIKHIEEDLILGNLLEHEEGKSLNIMAVVPTFIFKTNDAGGEDNKDTLVSKEDMTSMIKRVRQGTQCSTGDEVPGKLQDVIADKKKRLKILIADDFPQHEAIDFDAALKEIIKTEIPQEKVKAKGREGEKKVEGMPENVICSGESTAKQKKRAKIKIGSSEEGKKVQETQESAISNDSSARQPGKFVEHEDVTIGRLQQAKKEETTASFQGDASKAKIAKKEKKRDVTIQESEGADSGVDESMDTEVVEQQQQQKQQQQQQHHCLKVGSGFVWDVPEAVEGHEDSSDESDQDEPLKKKSKKMSRAERLVLAKEEEKRLHQLECARLDAHRTPQSALDYEELLQSSPNSSAVWIQFISFHLENAEVDQAKAIAKRALQVIDVREEEERLNVWTVLLRLEVNYGTSETVASAYSEALTTNDQLKVQCAMAMVYAEAGQIQEADKVYFIMSKKYSTVLDVWVKAGIHFFKHKRPEEARKFMERALLSLDKRDHVQLINRYGQLEFRFGEAERGRTIFESLLSSYPKRIDIWSVYVDLLAKHKDIEGARNILERMTGLKLRLQKMRIVFKKFLAFEKEYGSSQGVEMVKKRVEEFVASTLH